MEPHQKTMHPCPFCDNVTLEVLTWPGHTAMKVSRSAAGGKTVASKKPGGFELLSETCSNCGKTSKEIKSRWKGGVNHIGLARKKKRLEELKVLGFSGNFKTK